MPTSSFRVSTALALMLVGLSACDEPPCFGGGADCLELFGEPLCNRLDRPMRFCRQPFDVDAGTFASCLEARTGTAQDVEPTTYTVLVPALRSQARSSQHIAQLQVLVDGVVMQQSELSSDRSIPDRSLLASGDDVLAYATVDLSLLRTTRGRVQVVVSWVTQADKCQVDVSAAPDAGVADSGTPDTAVDSRVVDSTIVDSATADTSMVDSTVVDSTVVDSSLDTSVVDSSIADSGGSACLRGLGTTGSKSTIDTGVGSTSLMRIAAGGGYVAWNDGISTMWIARGDGTAKRSAVVVGQRPIAVAIGGSYVFWAASSTVTSSPGVTIYRSPLDAGGGTSGVLTPESIATEAGEIQTFAASASRVFWIAIRSSTDFLLQRSNHDGSALATIATLPSSGAIPRSMTATSSHVIWSRFASSSTPCYEVSALPVDTAALVDGGTPTSPVTLYSSGSAGCSSATYFGLGAEGMNVYFHRPDSPSVMTAPIGGTARVLGVGRGDGTGVGVSAGCAIAWDGAGYVGLPISGGAPAPMPWTTGTSPTFAIDGDFLYSLVTAGSSFAIVRLGL